MLRLPHGRELLVTTDFSLEGVHFRREWHSPEVIGHRCLGRGLSDIAAMGGDPFATFLSLALPRELPQRWLDGFSKGLLSLADHFHVTLAGGDTAQSPKGILADIVVIGSVPRGKAVLRSGALPGDRIYVTGALGSAAAALDMLFSGRKPAAADYPRHFYPLPRIEVGRHLREKNLASAMIDISDGLSTDLNHICEESGVGAEIYAEQIPRDCIGKRGGPVDLKFALHGGDEYELIFTSPPSRRIPRTIAGVPLTEIGHITRAKKSFLVSSTGQRSEFRAQGWEHFKTKWPANRM